ncbi:hypothetical protein GBAR_LOCUS27775 [Geodia barretti]|uniref:Uncharacterized protein n=1 Tax=Geodia barretti TaxID=519541 RepID=A0AA35TMZ7_GEOBA|nr:hypothetical protein GBAR_LOCUS27775 [Geodia barretti]
MAGGGGGGGKELFSSEDSGRWRASLDSYDQVLTLLASSKKRGSSSSSLKLLDKWYQKELSVSVTSRSKPHLTHEELCQLMQWKLARGKFRPRLMEMVRQNSPEDVEKVTGSAIGALPDLERAVRLATQLRAVGPATASGLPLSLCRTGKSLTKGHLGDI